MAPTAAQPSDWLTVGVLSAELGELNIELPLSFFELMDGEHVAVEGGLAHGIVETQLLEPCPVATSPVMFGLPVDAVAAQQELAETMPCSQQIHSHIVAAATQIA